MPEPPPVLTGPDGSFVLDDLPVGTYSIRTQLAGYGDGYWGVMSPQENFDGLLRLNRDRRADIVIKMWQSGVISGTVTEQDGQPAVGLVVRPLRRNGAAWGSVGRNASTDDRGRYRMSVPPGDYLVMIQSGLTANKGVLRTTYAPNALTSVTATPANVRSGQETLGVDVRIEVSDTPGAGRRISGVVRGPDGPAANLEVRLVPAGSGTTAAYDSRLAKTDAQGRFDFFGIASGDYALQAVRFPEWAVDDWGQRALVTMVPGGRGYLLTPGPLPTGAVRRPEPSRIPSAATLIADVPITVGERDQTSLDVPLTVGSRLRGQLVFDGPEAPQQAALTSVSIWVLPADDRHLPNIPQGGVDADKTFQSVGLPPGAYTVAVMGAPSPWYVVSVQASGREIADRPINLAGSDVDVVVTLTRKVTTISGTVRDAQGSVAASGRVYVFARDETLRQPSLGPSTLSPIRQVQSNPDGSFEFTRMTAGDYFVAYTTEPSDEWGKSGFWRSLERTAVPVRIDLGETKTVDLRIAAPR
jgi:hypothetical protein